VHAGDDFVGFVGFGISLQGFLGKADGLAFELFAGYQRQA